MNNHSSSRERASIDRREFIKDAAVASLAASLGLQPFRTGSSALLAAQPASDGIDVAQSPYGVCAHIGGGEEWDQMPENLKIMKDAGIRWVRADFSWNNAEWPEGNWHFDRLDRTVEETNKLGLQVLPILDYDVPWATPAYRRLEKWLEYVRRTVERYKDRLRYWEVWNEENLQGFWKEEPDGANYAILLKETYKTIKSIDPKLVVVFGGLAGVPVDFFEKTLDSGAADAFDVMNIHPYRGGMTTRRRLEQFASEIDAFRQALKKRNLPAKPIWITEMGWATPPTFGEDNTLVVSVALRKLYPNQTPKIAIFYDKRYDPAQAYSQSDFYNYLPDVYRGNSSLATFISVEELGKISVKDFDMLIMPPSETFPSDCFGAAEEFVKAGGTLVLLGGVPFYYESRFDEKTERYVQTGPNPNFEKNLDALRISWYAWWTRKDVPEEVPAVVAPEFANEASGYSPAYRAGRFFDGAKLKDGDEMISIVNGQNESFKASSACIYKFNSDYQGAIVISSAMGVDGVVTNRSTVANQAVFLSQSYLLAFANGIERYFWYEFQAPERDDADPEHHFGIVHQQLDPKPGFFAYQTLSKARPAGSRGDKLTLSDDLCIVSWDRPDGQKGWALWTPNVPREIPFEIDGAITDAFDYLGNKVSVPEDANKLNLAQGVLYLVGPNQISAR